MLVAVADEVLGQRVAEAFGSKGYLVENDAGGSVELLSRLSRRGVPPVDLLVLDISANLAAGLILLRAIFGEAPSLPVILVTDASDRLDVELGRPNRNPPLQAKVIRRASEAPFLSYREGTRADA